MGQCAGIKQAGGRCAVVVGPSQEYCYAHDPTRSEERRRNASKAAKSKPNRELQGVKDLCKDLTERVLSGKLQPGPAAVANQLINTRLRAIEQERKNKETEELAERLALLEGAMEQRGGRRSWGT